MPLERKPNYNEMIALVRQGILPHENRAAAIRRVAAATGYSEVHIRRQFTKMKIKKAPRPQPLKTEGLPLTPQKIEELAAQEEPPTLDAEIVEPTPAPPLIPTPEQKEELAQLIQSRQISALFQSVNSWIPPQYQRPPDAIDMLGTVWEAPLNRLFEKYVDENIDLYFAIICTVIVFSPVPVMVYRDWRAQHPTTPSIQVKTP